MNYVQETSSNFEQLRSLISGILSIVSLIGAWKILTDNGVPGWKCLIPFYCEYAFSETCEEEKLGKKVMYWGLGIFFGMLIAIFITILGIVAENKVLIGVGLLLVLIAFGCSIYYMVLWCKLKGRFLSYNGAESWWVAVWLLLTPIANIYFAFFYKYPEYQHTYNSYQQPHNGYQSQNNFDNNTYQNVESPQDDNTNNF